MSHLHACLPAALASLLGLGACAPGGASAPAQVTPFQFKTSEDVTLDAQVLLDGQPLPNAVVQVHARTVEPLLDDPGFDAEGNPLPPAIPDQFVGPLPIEAGGGLLFIGATDGQGRLQAPVFAPTAIEWFDVVVTRNGATGPFTDAEWLLDAGPFNVASRTTWSAAGLRNVRVELQEAQL